MTHTASELCSATAPLVFPSRNTTTDRFQVSFQQDSLVSLLLSPSPLRRSNAWPQSPSGRQQEPEDSDRIGGVATSSPRGRVASELSTAFRDQPQNKPVTREFEDESGDIYSLQAEGRSTKIGRLYLGRSPRYLRHDERTETTIQVIESVLELLGEEF